MRPIGSEGCRVSGRHAEQSTQRCKFVITVVSSEDRGKSEDQWKGYEDYEMQGRNQVLLVVL
jgi:hypothetical protein